MRQGIEVGGDTTYDVYANGRDFQTSLATNAIGSVLGEAGGLVIGASIRQGFRGAQALTSQFDTGRLNPLNYRFDQTTFFAGVGLPSFRGRGPVSPRPFADSPDGVRLFKEASAFRGQLPGTAASKQYRNIAVADVIIDGQQRTVRFVNGPAIQGKQLGIHSEERLIQWYDILKNQQGRDVEVLGVFSDRIPCGSNRANCIGKLGYAFGENLDVFFNIFRGAIR